LGKLHRESLEFCRVGLVGLIFHSKMLGFRKAPGEGGGDGPGSSVDRRLCTNRFNGKYPHVGIYDCRAKIVWVCKPLGGQAIRTSHARLITGADNATSTAWKDRFLCYWFYTPNSGEGFIHGYPIDWAEGQVVVRTDPNWDYDRQRLIPAELTNQVEENLGRQIAHGKAIFAFFQRCGLKYPFNLHFIAQRAAHSQFYFARHDPAGKKPPSGK